MTTAHAPNILLVDDDPLVLRAVDRTLRGHGYRTMAVASAANAHEMLDLFPVDAIVSDLNIALPDGRNFAAAVSRQHARPVVVITGMSDLGEALRLMDGTVPQAMLAKPFDGAHLVSVLAELLRDAARAPIDDQRTACELAQGMARALALRDVETEAHAQRVALWTRRVARAIGMSAHDCFWAEMGALLHDVGKIGVPDTILKKPGSLTPEEWTVMRSHAELGARLIRPVTRLAGARDVVLHHHESWDGTGYPNKLAGEAIPLAARAFAPVDAYDAMTSDRPYRRGMSHEDAIARLIAGRGVQFDPAVVDAILAIPTEEWLEVRAAVEAGATVCASEASDAP